MTREPDPYDLKSQLEAVQADDEAGLLIRQLRAQARAAKTLRRSLSSLTEVVTPAQAARAQATENAWRDMDREFKLLTATEVGELVGSTSKSPKSYATDARKDGRILGVKRMNMYLYPAFQFEHGKPRPIIRTLREIAEELDISDESILLWMTAPTTWWAGNSRPVDHLSEPDKIVQAFESHYGAEW